jgi:hypothetical protein
MSTTTRKRLLAMAGVTAGVAAAVVAPSPAHAAVAPAHGPSGSELGELKKGLDALQATGAGTTSLGTCRSWRDITAENLVVYVPSLTRNGSLDCDLRNGNFDNHAVYKLQDAMIRCYGQDIDRDGDFGIDTHRAVKNVQAFHEQTVNGLYSLTLGSEMFLPVYDRANGQWTGICI